MDVLLTVDNNQWEQTHSKAASNELTYALENGKVIFYPNLSFKLLPEEQKFLSAVYSNGKAKNISYDHNFNLLRGVDCNLEERSQLSSFMSRFNQHATQLVSQMFPNYMPHLQVAKTSYRPVEICGRKTSYKKDDTRLHVDAFASSPNQGKRILRVFSNINPNAKDRVWRLGEPFEAVVSRFLPQIKKPWISGAWLKRLKITKSLRSQYDHIMLELHNRMKRDLDYQKNVTQMQMQFPPNSTWVVQTDHVSHAAMSGQFLLEQTFYLPVEAMKNPGLSPLKILERRLRQKLV